MFYRWVVGARWGFRESERGESPNISIIDLHSLLTASASQIYTSLLIKSTMKPQHYVVQMLSSAW